MPVSTRKSLALAGSDNSKAQDVTKIMNDLANVDGQTPSRKRQRASGMGATTDPSPQKKFRLEIPQPSSAQGTPSLTLAKRKSGALKPRHSFPARTPASRRNDWDLPQAEIQQRESNQPEPVLEPLKKLRPLGKQKAPTTSPFKGRGTLQTKSSARVNLDDSPAKQTRLNLAKVKNSLTKTGSQTRKKLTRVNKTTAKPEARPRRSTRLSLMAGDPFVEAQRENDEPLTPNLGLGCTPPNKSRQPEFSPLKANRKRSARDDSGKGTVEEPRAVESDDANASVTVGTDADDVDPQVTLSADEYGDDSARDDDDEDEDEDDDDDRESSVQDEMAQPGDRVAEQSGITVPASSPRERRETESQKRATKSAEAAAAEEAEKLQLAREAALRGVQEAVECHDLTEPWVELLVTAAQLEELRSTQSPASLRGKAVQRVIHDIRKALQTQRRMPLHLPVEKVKEMNQEMMRNIQTLYERCADINNFKTAEASKALKGRERNLMIHDVYQHLLPGTIKLAKRVLRVRFVDSGLSQDARIELAEVLRVVEIIVKTAREWRPRPFLEGAIKSLVASKIPRNLYLIMQTYKDAIDQAKRTENRNRFKHQQEADKANFNAMVQKRSEEIRARHKHQRETDLFRYQQELQLQKGWPPGEATEVVDIDDIVDNGSPPTQASTYGLVGVTSAESQHKISPFTQSRPLVKRHPTEEIPPPSQYKWTEKEMQALLNGLQLFEGEGRFEDIVKQYGGHRGILQRFDVNQLVAQAQWLKQRMAPELRQPVLGGDDFKWLRSVPSP